MELSRKIAELVSYGLDMSLIEQDDICYTINRILNIYKTESFVFDIKDIKNVKYRPLEEILTDLNNEALKRGLIEYDSVVYRDLFDTELMAVMTKRPSEVTKEFYEIYEKSEKDATDYYFNLSKASDYIRTYRVKKDIKWKTDSKYGEIDITINLSKPEKDPLAIARAKKMETVQYPLCQLCVENEGYAGRANHPARGNHRIIPVNICGEPWGFQYSPYVYYNEHCIVFNKKHIPMKIDENIFMKLFSFVEKFPHYFVGSNADLPIVGGSILTHEHFQGGNYEFAMAKADIEKTFTVKGYEDITCGVLHWPLSVIRLSGKDAEKIAKLAAKILRIFKEYTDESAFIFAKTDGVEHNTITPIARMKNGNYELDLALRNNITTKEHPFGVYHPHENLHHIKKENIGLIEVMGLAVLPARLKDEFENIAEKLSKGMEIEENDKEIIHKPWVDTFKEKCIGKTKEEVLETVKDEAGKVFVRVLEDAGIFKCTKEGREHFDRFINTIINHMD